MTELKHIQKTLTPIILQEGMVGFETVQDIEDKLNDPEVFNVAITGPYGSGKSTVLKSLKTRYADKHRFLTISLASLTGDNDEDKDLNPEGQQKVELDNLFNGSILNTVHYNQKIMKVIK